MKVEDAVRNARSKIGETSDKYGQPAKLGWLSTDTTAKYVDGNAVTHEDRFKVRMGANGEVRVIALAPNLGLPDVYDLNLSVAYQNGTLVIVDWDKGAPTVTNPWEGGGLSCATCGSAGGLSGVLVLSGALYLPNLAAHPTAPATGALFYSVAGVAYVVDSLGSRAL